VHWSFTAVKLAGALYLVWLGLQAIRHAGAHEAAGRRALDRAIGAVLIGLVVRLALTRR
jgi:threonine/homoserine/homoserine lactone efflux protein